MLARASSMPPARTATEPRPPSSRTRAATMSLPPSNRCRRYAACRLEIAMRGQDEAIPVRPGWRAEQRPVRRIVDDRRPAPEREAERRDPDELAGAVAEDRDRRWQRVHRGSQVDGPFVVRIVVARQD